MFQEIIEATCDEFGIKKSDLFARRRHQVIARPRQVVMHLACKITKLSLNDIGRRMAGPGDVKAFDHTTVMYARDRIEAALHQDDELRAKVERITSKALSLKSRRQFPQIRPLQTDAA